jgi:hypothetical protein
LKEAVKYLHLFATAFILIATAGVLRAQDLSHLDYNSLVSTAKVDAKQYYAAHKPIVRDNPLNNDYTADIGITLAMNHGLVGQKASVYAATFFQTLDALIANP